MSGPAVVTTAMEYSIHRKGSAPDDPDATTVRAVDEGAGAFVELRQEERTIRLDLEELEAILKAARLLIRGVEAA